MIKRKKKTQEELEEIRREIQKQNDFFLEIWEERKINGKNYSEVSGKRIYGQCRTIYMHHILPKSKYPHLKYKKDNIIILTFEEHQRVEQDMYYYDEINKRREQLKTKYNI